MKNYPIVDIEKFNNDVKELERFVENLPSYVSEIDINDLSDDTISEIFNKSYLYDYHSPVVITKPTILYINDELLKQITEYTLNSTYNKIGNIFIICQRREFTIVCYLDNISCKRYDIKYYSQYLYPDYEPYATISCKNYTIIGSDENIKTLKDVVKYSKEYLEYLLKGDVNSNEKGK